LRVHPATFRAAKLYWQVPVIFISIFGALLFNLFAHRAGGEKQVENLHLVNVAVLAVDLNEDELIHPETITWRKIALDFLPRGYIGSKRSLIGCTAAGPIPASYPVTPIMIKGNCAALKSSTKAS